MYHRFYCITIVWFYRRYCCIRGYCCIGIYDSYNVYIKSHVAIKPIEPKTVAVSIFFRVIWNSASSRFASSLLSPLLVTPCYTTPTTPHHATPRHAMPYHAGNVIIPLITALVLRKIKIENATRDTSVAAKFSVTISGDVK